MGDDADGLGLAFSCFRVILFVFGLVFCMMLYFLVIARFIVSNNVID